jgi:ketosteroid isomerase-like protein
MSDADIQVVRDQFEAVNRRDWARAMELYADDVVMVVPPAEGIMNPGTYEGKAAVGEWFGDWFGTFGEDYHFEIDEAREIDELIFVHANHGGHGRLSGVEVSSENSYLYGVRDGKVTRVEFYATRDDALQAVESRE